MEISNHYKKEEDFALWELHLIRHKMAEKRIDLNKLHESTQIIIEKYKLKNMRFKEKESLK